MNFTRFTKSIAAFAASAIASPIGVGVCAALHITNTPLYFGVIALISALGGGLGTYAAPANTPQPSPTQPNPNLGSSAAQKANNT